MKRCDPFIENRKGTECSGQALSCLGVSKTLVNHDKNGHHPFYFRKRSYAGVVFTRFCDLWFSVLF